MATARLGAVRRLFDHVRGDPAGDDDLLSRWNRGRDPDAFAALVRRHGGLVLGVCRRVLGNHADAEDACQATFLVLARKAAAVRPPGVLGPWLHGVAYRTALKARGRAFRRRAVERDYAEEKIHEPRAAADGEPDLRPLIDEQLDALPPKYRLPLVLCALEGLGKAEAAERLGLPEGTVSSRLARARDLLRDRLTRRGVVVPAAVLGTLLAPGALQASVPAGLSAAVSATAAGTALAPSIVLTLTHEMVRTMTLAKFKLLSALTVAAAIAGGGFGLVAGQKPAGEKPAAEKPPKPAPAAGEKPQKPKPEAAPGEKPQKPVDPNAPKPQKPAGDPNAAPGLKLGGQVAAVDAAARTVTIAHPGKGDKPASEQVVKVAAGAKVLIDGKPGELAAVPKGAFAGFMAAGGKGEPKEATEVRVTGPTVSGKLTAVDVKDGVVTLTLDAGEKGGTRTLKVAAEAKLPGSKTGAVTDLKPGDKVTAVLTTDGAAALTVSGGGAAKPAAEKPAKPAAPPGEKPAKPAGEKPSPEKPAKPGAEKPAKPAVEKPE